MKRPLSLVNPVLKAVGNAIGEENPKKRMIRTFLVIE
jgi:hypothetical protein